MSENRKLLIVEDDPGLQKQLRWSFEDYDVMVVGNRSHAIEQVRQHKPPVMTLDLGLPPDADGSSEGLATLEKVLEFAPNTKIIVVTGNDDRVNAVRAIGLGAYDFYHKPIDSEILSLIVSRAYRVHELESENRKLSIDQDGALIKGVIACSEQMHSVCKMVEKVAPSDATVLILGDSGSGKELCCRALHQLSNRASARFVAINCAAIPENLLESELFGYEKGAFTGAARTTQGKIEYADGGTLFLDEIGDLPMALQAKLLRFLQERVVEHIGGREEIPVNVRVVCATHQNLQEKIQSGEFREDLYYRLSEIPIKIPRLSERKEDILLLARSFLDKSNSEHGKKLAGFAKEALLALESHNWPGNVRELKNRVRRAVIMAEGKQVTAQDLELDVEKTKVADGDFKLKEIREHAEREAITRALAHVDGKISQAATLLGVSRPTLYNLIEKLDIKVSG